MQHKKGKCRLQGEGFGLFLKGRGRKKMKGQTSRMICGGGDGARNQPMETCLRMAKKYFKNRMTCVQFNVLTFVACVP